MVHETRGVIKSGCALFAEAMPRFPTSPSSPSRRPVASDAVTPKRWWQRTQSGWIVHPKRRPLSGRVG